MCLRQVDLKIIIAYSSVVHIRIVIAGLISISILSLRGGILLMVAHGFCSSGIFFILNSFYERYGRRSFFIILGGILWVSVIPFFWLILCVFNLSSPPSLNYLSEILLMIGMFNLHRILYLMGGLYLFVGGLYCIYMFVLFRHGDYKVGGLTDGIFFRELIVRYFHCFPLFFIFLLRTFILYLLSL